MATGPSTFLKQIKLSDTNIYDLVGQYIIDSEGNFQDWDDIEELLEKSFKVIISTNAANTPSGVQWKSGETTITGTLTAAAADKDAIYFVPSNSGVAGNSYVEYIAINSTTWEQVGTTAVDIKDKANKGKYNTTENGAHTHSVSANVQIPKISAPTAKFGVGVTTNFTTESEGGDALGKNTKLTTTAEAEKTFLSAGASGAGYTAPTNNIKFVKSVTASKKSTLGADTTFATEVTTNKKYLSASASGLALSTGTGTTKFLKGYTPDTNKFETTTLKGVADTATVAHVTNEGSANNGSACEWYPIATDGVLSFYWAPNVATTVTFETKSDITNAAVAASSATTVATGSLSKTDAKGSSLMTGLGTIDNDFAVTSASINNPSIALSLADETSAGAVQVATAIDKHTTTANANDRVSVMTGVSVATDATAITALNDFTQPTITLSSAATGDVEVMTGVGEVSTSAITTGTDANVVPVLNSLTIKTQPAATLNNTGNVTFVTSASASNETKSFTGTATEAGAHAHETNIQAQ